MIHIPIPIGVRYVARVRASSLKVVSCENCKQSYAILLDVEARGEDLDLLFLDSDGSKDRADAQARENLAAKIRNSVAVIPCPQCGFYQEDMVRQLKENAWTNPVQIIGAIVVLLSFIPLACDISYSWIMTLVLAAAGVMLLVRGYVVSYRYDPNAGDPGPRKVIGQNNSVWGDQLGQMLSQIAAAAAKEESDDASKV